MKMGSMSGNYPALPGGMPTRWCVLRTSGARTLPLVESLTAAGYDVYAPKVLEQRRRPRSKATVERVQAIAPGFVFLREEQLGDVLRLLAQPTMPHPSFSVFRHAGAIPLILDTDIAGLRAAEEKAQRLQRRSRQYIYPRGTRVRTDEGGFVGLEGVVEESSGRHALICFEGRFRVKVAAWLLRVAADEVEAQPARLQGRR